MSGLTCHLYSNLVPCCSLIHPSTLFSRSPFFSSFIFLHFYLPGIPLIFFQTFFLFVMLFGSFLFSLSFTYSPPMSLSSYFPELIPVFILTCSFTFLFRPASCLIIILGNVKPAYWHRLVVDDFHADYTCAYIDTYICACTHRTVGDSV